MGNREKMSFLRSSISVIATIRQITVKNVAQTQRENALKAVTIGNMPRMVDSVVQSQQNEFQRAVVAHISMHKATHAGAYAFGNQSAQFAMPIGAKCVFTSQSARAAKMFASFDLSSVSISFVGMMGDFAVWAITDVTTGETMFLIDDNGGSEIYFVNARKLTVP